MLFKLALTALTALLASTLTLVACGGSIEVEPGAFDVLPEPPIDASSPGHAPPVDAATTRPPVDASLPRDTGSDAPRITLSEAEPPPLPDASGTLVSLAVTPFDVDVNPYCPMQLRAIASYSNGAVVDVTSQATWSSGEASVATVGAMTGLVTIANPSGATNITATFDGLSASATVESSNVTVMALSLTPGTATIAVGATQQFTSRAVFADGTNCDVTTTVPWFTVDETVATISTSGLATGVSPGQTGVGSFVPNLQTMGLLTVQ